jgi:hypothetical protein
LIRTAATTAVIAGTATAVSGGVSRRQQRRAYEEQAEMEARAAPAYEAPPEPDYMAELQRLAQLKSQGIISQEEFEAKKKQLLGI